MRGVSVLLVLSTVAASGCASPSAATSRPASARPVGHTTAPASAGSILARYVAAWRGPEEMPLTDTLFVRVTVTGPGGGTYHAIFAPSGRAELREGAHPRWMIGYRLSMETLRRLDQGTLDAQTAMGAERADQVTPLYPEFPPERDWGTPGWTRAWETLYRRFHAHFWNRSWPEVLRFGREYAGRGHGALISLLHYEPGLRSGWFAIDAGMHVNADPRDQTNPFESLLILTRGEIQMRIGGVERTLRQGEAVLIPAGVTHEFWARPGQGGEGILLMFGPGA